MKPLVDKKYLLHKYPGKGGWTYASITEIAMEKRGPRAWMRVKGTIDGFEISKYNLAPMKDGSLFLPLRVEIRKKINKYEGDRVHITLYPDADPLEIPGEFILCLEDEPKALKFFNSISDSEKRLYILWIYGAKKEETRAARIAKAIDKLSAGMKLYEKED